MQYRAWDIENNRMGKVSKLDFTKGEVTYDLGYERHTIPTNKSIVMSKIGEDIEGTEVYELDVLTNERYPYQEEGRRIYDGIIEYSKDNVSFILTKVLVDKTRRGILDMVADTIEDINTYKVIGNVLEKDEFRKQWERLN